MPDNTPYILPLSISLPSAAQLGPEPIAAPITVLPTLDQHPPNNLHRPDLYDQLRRTLSDFHFGQRNEANAEREVVAIMEAINTRDYNELRKAMESNSSDAFIAALDKSIQQQKAMHIERHKYLLLKHPNFYNQVYELSKRNFRKVLMAYLNAYKSIADKNNSKYIQLVNSTDKQINVNSFNLIGLALRKLKAAGVVEMGVPICSTLASDMGFDFMVLRSHDKQPIPMSVEHLDSRPMKRVVLADAVTLTVDEISSDNVMPILINKINGFKPKVPSAAGNNNLMGIYIRSLAELIEASSLYDNRNDIWRLNSASRKVHDNRQAIIYRLQEQLATVKDLEQLKVVLKRLEILYRVDVQHYEKLAKMCQLGEKQDPDLEQLEPSFTSTTKLLERSQLCLHKTIELRVSFDIPDVELREWLIGRLKSLESKRLQVDKFKLAKPSDNIHLIKTPMLFEPLPFTDNPDISGELWWQLVFSHSYALPPNSKITTDQFLGELRDYDSNYLDRVKKRLKPLGLEKDREMKVSMPYTLGKLNEMRVEMILEKLKCNGAIEDYHANEQCRLHDGRGMDFRIQPKNKDYYIGLSVKSSACGVLKAEKKANWSVINATDKSLSDLEAELSTLINNPNQIQLNVNQWKQMTPGQRAECLTRPQEAKAPTTR